MSLNSDNTAGGDIVVGVFDRSTGVFTPTTVNPNAVQVFARRTASSGSGSLPLFFGPAFGVNTVDVQSTAIAIATPPAVLLVLDPHASAAMNLSAGGSVTVEGGNIQVDSDSPTGLSGVGTGTIRAVTTSMVGNYQLAGSNQLLGRVNVKSASIPDPLASLPTPPQSADQGTVVVTGSQVRTLSPGYYSGGITAVGSASVTLQPGLYTLGGVGLSVAGNASLTANGVMIYTQGTGAIALSGNGAITITPPNPAVNTFPDASQFQAIAIFQDRSDTAPARIAGNGRFNITGAIYIPSAAMTVSGNGDTIGSAVIVKTLTVTGQGTLTVNATGPQFPQWLEIYLVQ